MTLEISLKAQEVARFVRTYYELTVGSFEFQTPILTSLADYLGTFTQNEAHEDIVSFLRFNFPKANEDFAAFWNTHVVPEIGEFRFAKESVRGHTALYNFVIELSTQRAQRRGYFAPVAEIPVEVC